MIKEKLNKQKDDIQRQALANWIYADKKGTVEMITGLGKTFIALHALYTMPKNNDIHLFLAETVDRAIDLEKDISKYNEIFGTNIHNDYNLLFVCYQTAYKWKNRKLGLVIADEIHDSLTPVYSQFYSNNKYDAILGLSATINRKTSYKHNELYITKGDILDKYAPVCFKYSIEQAQKEKTARKLNIYVIQHKLDSVNKNIVAGNIRKRFFQTEEAAYSYWDKQHKMSWFIEEKEKRDLKIRITSTKRSNILYTLGSKIEIVKTLLHNLTGKTIVFGNSIDSLQKVTPNVVSSRNKEDKNKEIREAFDTGKSQVIGSFKKLKQGANLVGLDNCILMSYYSTDKDFIQRIGRLRQNDEIGNVFIILTMNTQEEIWFSKMIENINNLNIIYCIDVDFCIKKIKNG
jgi:superfamily II DNA or RNA helicase